MIDDLKVIIPPQPNFNQFYNKFGQAAQTSMMLWKKLFEATRSTWGGKATYRHAVELSNTEVSFSLYMVDRIYYFLNFGTKKRYAVMPAGWVSKTAPGRFFPGAGSGRFDRSDPGSWDFREWAARTRAIEARRWDLMIQKQSAKTVVKYFRKAMEDGARDSGHSSKQGNRGTHYLAPR